jgi:hypothetical protein
LGVWPSEKRRETLTCGIPDELDVEWDPPIYDDNLEAAHVSGKYYG